MVYLLTVPIQEANEMNGSRGEANFVWRCKKLQGRLFLDATYDMAADNA